MSVSYKQNVPATKIADAPKVTTSADGDKVVSINAKSASWIDFAKNIDAAGDAKRKEGHAIFNSARDIPDILPARMVYKSDADHDVSLSKDDTLKGLFSNAKLRSAVSRYIMAGFGTKPEAKMTEQSQAEVAKWSARKANVDRAIHVCAVVQRMGHWHDNGFNLLMRHKDYKDGALVDGAVSVIRKGKVEVIDKTTTVTFGKGKEVIAYIDDESKGKSVNPSYAFLQSRAPLQGKAESTKAGKGKSIIGTAETLTGLVKPMIGKNPSDDVRKALTALRDTLNSVLGVTETVGKQPGDDKAKKIA